MKFKYNPRTKKTDYFPDDDICNGCYHEIDCPLLACIQNHMVYPKDNLEMKSCQMYVGAKYE